MDVTSPNDAPAQREQPRHTSVRAIMGLLPDLLRRCQDPGPDVSRFTGKLSLKHFYVTGRIFSPLAAEKRLHDMRDLLKPLEYAEQEADRFKWSLDLTAFPGNIYTIEAVTLLFPLDLFSQQAARDRSQLIQVIS